MINAGLTDIPNTLLLNGYDAFQHFISTVHADEKDPCTDSRMIIEMEGVVTERMIEERIVDLDQLAWINSYKLKTGRLLRKKRVERGEHPQKINVISGRVSEADYHALHFEKIPSLSDAWIEIDLVHLSGERTALILSNNHIILDITGMQYIAELLGGVINPDNIDSWSVNLKRGKGTSPLNAFAYLFGLITQKVIDLRSGKGAQNATGYYRRIKFTEAETTGIETQALQSGSKFGVSLYYLACTVKAMAGVKKPKEGLFWVPVTVDTRPKGKRGPVLQNHISMMFFKVRADKVNSIVDLVSEFSGQMIYQIKSKIVASYSSLSDAIKSLPRWLYAAMVTMPSKGVFASFAFSDLGEVGTESFLGKTVITAYNLPVNPNPPGFNIAYMKFKGALSVVVGCHDSVITAEKFVEFENSLKESLTGGGE